MSKEHVELKSDLKQYLGLVLTDINNLVELFNEGRDKIACERVADITDKLAIVIEVLNVIESQVSIGDINSILLEIVEGLQNEDYVLVSDLFNYEVKPLLEEILNSI